MTKNNLKKFKCLLLLIAVGMVLVIIGCTSGEDDPIYRWYIDADGDGYGDMFEPTIVATTQPAGYVEDYTDCDDTNAERNPGQIENVNDDIDHDCDNCPSLVCCHDGDNAVLEGDVLIEDDDDLNKLKYGYKYRTTITGNLRIENTSFTSLTNKKELDCLSEVEGNLIIRDNDFLCDENAEEFAGDLTVDGTTDISANNDSDQCD